MIARCYQISISPPQVTQKPTKCWASLVYLSLVDKKAVSKRWCSSISIPNKGKCSSKILEMHVFEPHPKDTVQRRGSRDPDPSFLINSRQEGLSTYYYIKTKGSATKSFTRHIAKWATIEAILKQPLSRPRLLLNLSPARGTGPGVRGRLPHPAYLGHNVPAGLQRVNGVRVWQTRTLHGKPCSNLLAPS